MEPTRQVLLPCHDPILLTLRDRFTIGCNISVRGWRYNIVIGSSPFLLILSTKAVNKMINFIMKHPNNFYVVCDTRLDNRIDTVFISTYRNIDPHLPVLFSASLKVTSSSTMPALRPLELTANTAMRNVTSGSKLARKKVG